MAGKNVLSLEGVTEVISKMKASGLSPFAFARREGMPYTTLRGYLRRFRKAGLDHDGGESSEGKTSISETISNRPGGVRKVSDGKISTTDNKVGGFVELVSDTPEGTTFSLHHSGFRLEFPLSSLSLVLAEIKNHA